MKEVGLIRLGKVALAVSQKALPAYRSCFSKHLFTQPQLLAIWVLMRFEDWTLRQAEARLREHAELRHALQLHSVPDYSTLSHFLDRLPPPVLERVLTASVEQFDSVSQPHRSTVAVDSTGLGRGAVSTYYLRRCSPQQARSQPWSTWLKWLVVVDVDTGLLLAQSAHAGPSNDSARLRSVLQKIPACIQLGTVLADAEFDSERNHQFVRQCLGAKSIIPARRGHASWQAHGVRRQMREHFPVRRYRKRAQVECFFSVVKRKFSSRAPGRKLENRCKQALLLGVTYSLYRLRHPRVQ